MVVAADAARVASGGPGGNCIKIGLPGKLILGDYFQENRTSRRPFLILRISFPGRPIFIQFVPVEPVAQDVEAVDLVAVAAHEVELAVAVGEAALAAAEAGHRLRPLHAVALALE